MSLLPQIANLIEAAEQHDVETIPDALRQAAEEAAKSQSKQIEILTHHVVKREHPRYHILQEAEDGTGPNYLEESEGPTYFSEKGVLIFQVEWPLSITSSGMSRQFEVWQLASGKLAMFEFVKSYQEPVGGGSTGWDTEIESFSRQCLSVVTVDSDWKVTLCEHADKHVPTLISP